MKCDNSAACNHKAAETSRLKCFTFVQPFQLEFPILTNAFISKLAQWKMPSSNSSRKRANEKNTHRQTMFSLDWFDAIWRWGSVAYCCDGVAASELYSHHQILMVAKWCRQTDGLVDKTSSTEKKYATCTENNKFHQVYCLLAVYSCHDLSCSGSSQLAICLAQFVSIACSMLNMIMFFFRSFFA